MLTSSSLSLVQANVGALSRNPHTRVPLLCCGMVLVCQGPGDWMFPGQFTIFKRRSISSNAACSAVWSRTKMKVADGGPPGSELCPQVTFATASDVGVGV